MKVLDENCEAAKKIRKAEEMLRNLGLEISNSYGGLSIIFNNGKEYVMIDGESNEIEQRFPAFCDGTKIQTIQQYRYS